MSTRTTWIALVATAALSAAASTGCQQLQCAEGTHEANGQCVPGNANPDNATCGPGTELGNDGMCAPVYPPTVCDPNTTEPQTDPNTGVTTCIGTGVNDCSANLPCPSAVNGKVNVCGRLLDLETSAPIQAAAPTKSQCGAGGATDGPCQLKIEFYDAIQFAQNPATASPLSHDAIYVDDCGRYKATNIQVPGLGFIGVGVDDASGQPDTHRLTGVAFPASANLMLNGVSTFVVTKATDMKWTTAASLSGGTFTDKGAYLGLFLYQGAPVPGVTVTNSDTVTANNDYYFSDTSPATRSDLVTDGPTGADGSALLLINDTSLHQMSGVGGEPSGCEWPHDQGGAIPTVMFVQPRIAETINTTTVCP